MNGLAVDLDLIRKYNVPGPRYTSYPPATHFDDSFTATDALRELETAQTVPRELSLYVHIPFCETLCWFCGCTTVITLNHRLGTSYIDQVIHEMDLLQPRVHPASRAVQIHWGGGSPTFLSPTEIRTLGSALRDRFPRADDAEASVEIDPRRLSPDHVTALREVGFNRASLGVQDFDPQVQEAIHRIQPRDMTAQVVRWIRDAGFASLNLDLIYGLPHQTVDSFRRTLDTVLELQPDRLAVFSYAHVPWIKPSQKIFEKRLNLPSPETKLHLLKLVVETLTGPGGYVCIGMDHFARPTDELAIAQRQGTLQRNFQGYSTRGGAHMLALGMSAISQTDQAYWQNAKTLPEYQAALNAGHLPIARGCPVSREDQIRRAVIMEIMCHLRLDYATLSRRLNLDFATTFASEINSLADLEQDGLVRREPGALQVTELGRLLIRIIAMRFDPRLAQSPNQRFSRAI